MRIGSRSLKMITGRGLAWIWLLISVLSLHANAAAGGPDYYRDMKKGWWWYQDPPKEETKKEEKPEK